MHQTTPTQHDTRGASDIAIATLGLLTSLLTGAACVAPLLAILLGVGGLGFLTRYAALRVPASLLTLAMLGLGFVRLHGRAAACATGAGRSRAARGLLWTATAFAVAINLLEYVVLPRLG